MASRGGRVYDFIVVGSGPGAAAWLRSALRHAPDARFLLLERGPYCKTDVLTERNPFKALSASRRLMVNYEHSVIQGNALGGGSAVNNYAWTTPSYEDLQHGLGAEFGRLAPLLRRRHLRGSSTLRRRRRLLRLPQLGRRLARRPASLRFRALPLHPRLRQLRQRVLQLSRHAALLLAHLL